MSTIAAAVLVLSALVPPILGNALALWAPEDAGAARAMAAATVPVAAAAWWSAVALVRERRLHGSADAVGQLGAARVVVATVGILAIAAPGLAAVKSVAAVAVDIAFWSVVLLAARHAGAALTAGAAVIYAASRSSALAFVLLDVNAPREGFLLLHRLGSVVAAGMIALVIVRVLRAGAVDTAPGAQKDAEQEVR